MDRHLHIISFDVPYPPDYGGVIPVFSLLESLKKAGITIHLHCFDYGRGPQPALDEFCAEVKYYSRNTGLKGFSLVLPYIVSSRINKDLRETLMKDDYPILMEGIHCSYLHRDSAFSKRNLTLRLHNVEFNYYRQLYLNSTDWTKKIYYFFESRLLKKYEEQLAKKLKIVTLAAEDLHIYKRIFGAKDIIHIPVVIPYSEVSSRKGIGNFCLYHGNLSVPENDKAAAWLVKNVFKDLRLPLVIAGKNPGNELKKLIANSQDVQLVENPSEELMQELIASAQINVLPSFNSTGIKLKFLNALFNGRHCVVNAATACATQVVSLCHVADDEVEFRNLINKLYNQEFTQEEIENRKEVLSLVFDNATNTRSLVQWIC